MILVTSSKGKLAEFKRFAPYLQIEEGRDLPEVLGTPDDIIVYKSLLAGKGFVVEDTIVTVDGEEIVDIKWRKPYIKDGLRIKWTVSLGFNDGDSIFVYRSEVEGTTCLSRQNEKAFGFDDIFIPDGVEKTLFELEEEKELFSPRKRVLDFLRDGKVLFVRMIEDIKPWEGKYQNS